MTLFLGSEHFGALAEHELVMEAARAAVEEEVAGLTAVPPRLQVPIEQGFMRVMPAGVGSVMGLKVMTLLEGYGTRYFILLYDAETTRLDALLDAAEVTKLRTAATTAVAGEMLIDEPPQEIGLLGTGFEAEGHLRTMARIWPLRRVCVYSRDAGRRTEFAERLGGELGIEVAPVESPAAAVAEAPVSVLATKSTEPVVDGSSFPPGAVVLSIGSTRPDLRELDHATLGRTGTLVVDDPVQVLRECGDVMSAIEEGQFKAEAMVSLAEVAADPGRLCRHPGQDLLAFKSVGTAVQDLALARSLVAKARTDGIGRQLGELSVLKRFDGVTVTTPADEETQPQTDPTSR
jgi:ornithine cyclodeaminase/alanine dehydrogenase